MAEKPVSTLGSLQSGGFDQAGYKVYMDGKLPVDHWQYFITPVERCVLEGQLLAPPWRRLMDLRYRLLHAIERASLETIISLRQTVGFLFNRALAVAGIGVV